MATKKKSSGKRFQQQVRKMVHGDLFTSIAVVSILLNILFLVSFLVLTSSDTFDKRFFQSAQNRYCNNISGLEQRAQELGDDKKALQEWEVDCIGKDFKPFYKEALDKYRAKVNQ